MRNVQDIVIRANDALFSDVFGVERFVLRWYMPSEYAKACKTQLSGSWTRTCLEIEKSRTSHDQSAIPEIIRVLLAEAWPSVFRREELNAAINLAILRTYVWLYSDELYCALENTTCVNYGYEKLKLVAKRFGWRVAEKPQRPKKSRAEKERTQRQEYWRRACPKSNIRKKRK